jgi:hypothetical protein
MMIGTTRGVFRPDHTPYIKKVNGATTNYHDHLILKPSKPHFPIPLKFTKLIDRGIRVLRDQFTGLCLGSIAQDWKICRDVRNLWKTVQKDGSSCHVNWKQPLAPTFFQN